MDRAQRLMLAGAGIIGATGVMAAAAGSHAAESRNLGAIAAICLSHGPALLALSLVGGRRGLRIAAAMLALGTLVFAGDLGIREWLGHGLFPGAAPIGGVAMVGGWVAIVAAAVFAPRR